MTLTTGGSILGTLHAEATADPGGPEGSGGQGWDQSSDCHAPSLTGKVRKSLLDDIANAARAGISGAPLHQTGLMKSRLAADLPPCVRDLLQKSGGVVVGIGAVIPDEDSKYLTVFAELLHGGSGTAYVFFSPHQNTHQSRRPEDAHGQHLEEELPATIRFGGTTYSFHKLRNTHRYLIYK